MNTLALKKNDNEIDKTFKSPSPFQNRVQKSAQTAIKFSEQQHKKIITRRSFSPCNNEVCLNSPGLSPIENIFSPVLQYNKKLNNINSSDGNGNEERPSAKVLLKPAVAKKYKKKMDFTKEMNSTKISLNFTPSPISPNGNCNRTSKNNNTSSDNNVSNNTTINSSDSVIDLNFTPTTIFNSRITINSILISKGLLNYKKLFKNTDLKSFVNLNEIDLINIGIAEKNDRAMLLQAIEDL